MQLILLRQIRHCDKKFYSILYGNPSGNCNPVAFKKCALLYSYYCYCYYIFSYEQQGLHKRLKRLKDIKAICVRMKPIYGYATDK
jgi:hypothetical protein